MTKTEAIAFTILHLEQFVAKTDCGVYSESEIEGAEIVAMMLRKDHPETKEIIKEILEARSLRRFAAIFRGFEHELSEDNQIELYGKVVAKPNEIL